MNISETEARKVANRMIPIFDQHLNKYSFKKYPAAGYKEYKDSYSSFSNPNAEIRDSLLWKWGHLGKSNFPQPQKSLIQTIEGIWPDYVNAHSKNRPTSNETFLWWEEQLPKTSFITVAYITHLVHHNEPLPIIDQHNFRAMNNFLSQVRSDHTFNQKPSTWNDITDLKSFMETVLKFLPGRSLDQLDRFLMMYGRSVKPKKKGKAQPPILYAG